MRVFKKAVTFVAFIALLSFPAWVYFNAQALTDWWQLRGYNPPAQVSTLATQSTMTPHARHIFYVNHPDLESDINQFRTDCNESEKTIVLGCYHGNQNGIFIYDVTDPRLAGVEQVTAAHEMLHAAYDRLSGKDRKYVDGLLQDYYSKIQNQRIIETVNSYKQSEPNDVVNEMHSIFGTEISNLPAALEAYYARYFTNRQSVTDFANTYQNEFNKRSDQIKAHDARLAQLKVQINQEEIELQNQLARLRSDRARLDTLRSSGQIDQYNASVASFNNQVNAYNAGVARLKADIAAYNQLVAERNSIAKELASLSKAIDTRLTPQTVR